MRMFALQKEVEYRIMSNIMMLELEEVSDYLDTRGLPLEITKVIDKFETHFEELKRAKRDVIAKASKYMDEASRMLTEEPVSLNQQVGDLRNVMKLRGFNESIIAKDAAMKEDLFKTLTGWQELRWKTGTPFRPESSLRDPSRRLNYPRNAIVQTSPIEMRNQAVGQTPGQEVNTINTYDNRTPSDTAINNDNVRVENTLFNIPTGSYRRQGINRSGHNQAGAINQRAQLQINNYPIGHTNPTSENNQEVTSPNSHDQTGYCDRDKDGNYMQVHINIAPCSGTNSKQTHELSRGQTPFINDRQTSGLNEQSRNAIETGQLQSNRVQRTQIDNGLAQVDNRSEVPAQLGGEICVICQRSGHTTIECPVARNPIVCLKCGKLDHRTFNCPSSNNSGTGGNQEQPSPPVERQLPETQRNIQVNTDSFSMQNQTLERDQGNQGLTPPQYPIPQNGIIIDQQGRKFFSG